MYLQANLLPTFESDERRFDSRHQRRYVGKKKCRMAVPKFTSDKNEGVRILVSSCVKNLDNIRMSLGRKSWESTKQDK